MERRAYGGADDLAAMQDLVSRRTAALGRATTMHPGDVPHRIYNGLRNHDPADMVHVWTIDDEIVAFGWDWRREGGSDFVFEASLSDEHLRSALDELLDLATVDGRVDIDVVGDDGRTIPALRDLGCSFMEDAFMLTGQEIGDVDVPESEFTVRQARYDEPAAIAEVHSGSFGSRWTAEAYAALMQTPGYNAERELVAEAPDGRLAGFTVTWHDPRNGIGYFEPVGVHGDFHRRGIGSLLLAAGMANMADHGLTQATVMHDFGDERTTAFYRNNGFEPIATVTRWERSSAGG